jgi:TetR/AcrR family transcriptional regulator of autoinduction and epiphytic fitness
VIDAMFELLQEGKVPPGADAIAERSGVSVASVFRYFDGIDDLLVHTFERFQERFAHLVDADIAGDRAERIETYVAARLDLYERAGMLMTVGRLRSLEHEPMVEASARWRARLTDQVRSAFAPELAAVSPALGNELAALVDALTSLESWDVMQRSHARSRGQIAATWTRALATLIDEWTSGDGGGHR